MTRLERELEEVQAKVGVWEREGNERRWREKRARVEKERRQQVEDEVRERVRIEEQERARIREGKVEKMKHKTSVLQYNQAEVCTTMLWWQK